MRFMSKLLVAATFLAATPANAAIYFGSFVTTGGGSGSFAYESQVFGGVPGRFDVAFTPFSYGGQTYNEAFADGYFITPNHTIFPNSVELNGGFVGAGSFGLRFFSATDRLIGPDGNLPAPNVLFSYFADGRVDVGGQSLTITSVSAVPEAGTWAMLLAGFGAIGFGLRSVKRRANGKLQVIVSSL